MRRHKKMGIHMAARSTVREEEEEEEKRRQALHLHITADECQQPTPHSSHTTHQQVNCLLRHQVLVLWGHKLGPGLLGVCPHQALQLRVQLDAVPTERGGRKTE